MNIFYFSTRIFLCLFGMLTALSFLQIGAGNTAVYFSFLLAICYGWPLYWVAVKGMPIRMGAPVFSVYNRETNLQTWRRTMALIIVIIGLSQFSEGKNGTGIGLCFFALLLTTISIPVIAWIGLALVALHPIFDLRKP